MLAGDGSRESGAAADAEVIAFPIKYSNTLINIGIMKRKYSSPRRQEQAAVTRQGILDAARTQFVSNGYAGTTIESIALAAAVSVPTFYLAFGNKRAVLLALLDQIEEETDQPDALQTDAGNPHRQLELYLELAVGRFTR